MDGKVQSVETEEGAGAKVKRLFPTYMLEGSFKHKDSLGNDSEVFAGGAQRFTAGRGIIHSEMPGKSKFNHGLQLWVNLPRRLKRIRPSYQQVNSFPKENKKQNQFKILLIKGDKNG